MRKSTGKVFILILAIALIASSCTEDTSQTAPAENTAALPEANEPSDPQEEKSRPPFPTSIEINLEEDSAVKTTIGPEGGSLVGFDAKGIEYILTIPEGALIAEEEITMTPIATVEGDVISDTFLAGVKLEPEGLHFLGLVSIEIISADIEESAVGFGAENGGQNFHLMPSQTGGGSMIITTTHFTEFGASEEGLGELGDFLSDVGEAWVEQQLASGNADQQLAALERWTEILIARGATGIDLNGWEPWTANMLSFILRTAEAAEANNWNLNSPGFSDLTTKMQSLIDLWFQQTDGVVQAIVDKCILGEIDYMARGEQITSVARWFIVDLGLETREEQFRTWQKALNTCNHKFVVWQANVLTTGEGLTSDISLGIEAESKAKTSYYGKKPLEVEYIDGFWAGTCQPREGSAEIGYYIQYKLYNLGIDSGNIIGNIVVNVKITEPVFIDCSQGFNIPADAQKPFHGGALELLNEDRVNYEGSWEFKLDFDPGGGIIAQFEEGPLTLTFPDGKYQLWQLVTIYQATPVE